MCDVKKGGDGIEFIEGHVPKLKCMYSSEEWVDPPLESVLGLEDCKSHQNGELRLLVYTSTWSLTSLAVEIVS